tara:strand:+ start:5301 stop:5654 length:354 start_codon:yes stop_codon:yes gene_type:complete
MAGAVSRKTWVRISGSRTGNGEISLANVPIRGWLRRVRCSAAGGGNVTVSLDEAQVPGIFGVVLAYGTTATPLDQEEDPGVFYQINPTATSGSVGTLFCEVTGAGVISVQLDIEPAN